MKRNLMNKKVAIIIAGTALGLTGCGSNAAQQNAPAEQATTEETVQEAETTQQEVTTEDIGEEKSDYIEDTVISTDHFTLTIPDEFKGKFLAQVNGNEISIFDKACNEAGFNGFVFSVIADKNKEVLPGGMYTKVGELADTDGNICDICMSYASEVQWDYNAYDEMPED